MAIVLYDTIERNRLYPLNTCRSTAELRCGIWSVEERWKLFAGTDNVYIQTIPLLQQLYEQPAGNNNIWVDASWLCNEKAMETISSLQQGEVLKYENSIIATTINPLEKTEQKSLKHQTLTNGKVQQLTHSSHLFQFNGEWIREDVRSIANSSNKTKTQSGNNTFVADGAQIKHSVINDETGPVYIGKHALVMEGSTIRGPFAMGDNAVLKMGSRIYGPVTMGHYSVAGGEIKNAVIQSFSNKAHDGYLGDSVIGQWCNLGAGTINSNVRNDAGLVQLWNPIQKKFEPVAQKCGMIMGDYCRTAIQTTINTGTIMDTGSSAVSNNLIRKYLLPFVQGDNTLHQKIPLHKLIAAISNWKKLKNQNLSITEEQIIIALYKEVFP